MANRNRNRMLSLRFTEQEIDALVDKSDKADMSLTDYIVSLSNTKPIVIIDDLNTLLSEIKRQGINLNQAMRYTHDTFGSHLDPLEDAINNCNEIYTRLIQLLEITEGKV